MSIVVSTPTGNIGRGLTEHLLDGGAEVTLLVRDPKKVADFAKRGATVHQGALDDAAFVRETTQGAKALFWLIPPDMTATDFRARQNQFADVGAAAVEANQIGHVVLLSSTGAQYDSGNGPIAGLHDAEQKFAKVAPNLLQLRAGYFMEILLATIPMIAAQKSVFQPMPAETKLAMVATRDIARVAADELLDLTWKGHRIRGVHGPADVDWNDVCAIIGKELGEPVQYMQVPGEAVHAALTGMGISEAIADLYVEMLEGFGTGRIQNAEPRTAQTTTPTTLQQFCRDTLVPGVKAAAATG